MVSKAVLFVGEEAGAAGRPRGNVRFLRPSPSPPALLPVANRPLISHVLQLLADAGISDVSVLSTPAVADRVAEAIDTTVPARLRARTVELGDGGTSDDALAAMAMLADGDPMLVHLGDSLSKRGLAPLIGTDPLGSGDALMLVEPGPGGSDEPVELAAKRCGVGDLRSAGFKAAGVFVLGAEVLEAAEDLGPRSTCELEIMAALARATDMGGSLTTRPVRQWWRYRRDPDVVLAANRFALEGLEPSVGGARLGNSEIQGGVVIDATARVESSIVRGPAIIGPGTRLTDAYVGPYTSIGAHVVIDGAEVENSVILPGASVCHIGGRLESSIIGPKAKVFRDFRLPRALRLDVGEGAEISLP